MLDQLQKHHAQVARKVMAKTGLRDQIEIQNEISSGQSEQFGSASIDRLGQDK